MVENLKTEIETFEKLLAQLVTDAEGKFALVVGDKLVGTYETYGDAVQEGYKIAGLDKQFLVKKISLVGDAAHYSRPLTVPGKVQPQHAQH